MFLTLGDKKSAKVEKQTSVMYEILDLKGLIKVYLWDGASLVAQLVKNRLQRGRAGFDPWVGKIPWRREQLPTPVFWPREFHGQSMGSQRVGHN